VAAAAGGRLNASLPLVINQAPKYIKKQRW
jgi:hypothetical protein